MVGLAVAIPHGDRSGGFVGKLPGQINVFIVEQASNSTPLRYVLLLLFTAIT